MVCSEIPFAGDSRRVEISQLICSVNQLTDFCMLRISTEGICQMTIVCFIQAIIRGKR